MPRPRNRQAYNPISSSDVDTLPSGDEEIVESEGQTIQQQPRQSGYSSIRNDSDNTNRPDNTTTHPLLPTDQNDHPSTIPGNDALRNDQDSNTGTEDEDNGERIKLVLLDSAQHKFHIDANPNWTVKKLKKIGESVHKVPPQSQRLIYRGKLLGDSGTLRESNITQDDLILHLFPKPRVVVASTSNHNNNNDNRDNAGGGGGDDNDTGGAHVPQIVYDPEDRGHILVLGSAEIVEAQNNVKLLSLLLLMVTCMRLLALFSIAMGMPDNNTPTSYSDDNFSPPSDYNHNHNHNHTDYNNNDFEYQQRSWGTMDYYDLFASGLGFYVATLGLKATTENTLRLANFYLLGTVLAGIVWNVWYVINYLLFYKLEKTREHDHHIHNNSTNNSTSTDIIELSNDDYVTVAFFMVIIPGMVWGLCCIRAWEFRRLLEDAEREATERHRSQLDLEEGDSNDDDDDNDDDGVNGRAAREMTELSSSSNSNTDGITSNRQII